VHLLVVRHAIAEDADLFAATGRDDVLRPLTEDGAKKMRRCARGLRTVVPSIDRLAASPLVRAAETAEILRAEYDLDGVETVAALAPDRDVGEVAGWLAAIDAGVVAIVGHEPQLGRLIAFLLGAGSRPVVAVKKGSACLLELGAPAGAGVGRLIWALPPSVLRDLAGR
jgi:phosphohistidine phosphatase